MTFIPVRALSPKPSEYSFFPFRFTRLDGTRYILTNMVGEYVVLGEELTRAFLHRELKPDIPEYATLKAKQFLTDTESNLPLVLLSTKYRTKLDFLPDFTSLHIFVVTLRCNNRCIYCQASRQCEGKGGFDMSEETADKAIEFMFRSPSRNLKVEFQGGEPLLNFPLVQYVVRRARERAATLGRQVEFVLCSNLAILDDQILHFCEENGICLSTSLDGPKELHNFNRPSLNFDSYDSTVSAIRRATDFLGPDKVSALMTTTGKSLECPQEIIDEYVRLGFSSIFLRKLNPYGYATRTNSTTSYSVDEFLEFYKASLDYILHLNYTGLPFREDYAALILRKILTPYGTGFVDLQSPAGMGISVIVFHHDGDVYLSDEARMLAEMGDKRFRLGNLHTNSYEEAMLGEDFLDILSSTMSEGVPGCTDCAFMPYCGSDPVRHYRVDGDLVGHKATSQFCRKHLGLFRHLIGLLEDDPKAAEVLRGWAQ